MELLSFYFGQPQLFVVPIEHLSPEGVDETFIDAAGVERGLSREFFALMSAAIRTSFERLGSLYAQDRRRWFPPRLTNLCVVTDAQNARPYYQPFVGSSLLLYASDFDPEVSNVEMATHQLIHAERLGFTRSVAKTVVGSLGYFVARTAEQRERFAEAAKLCARPDAQGVAALGKAMPWIGELWHETLRPPPSGDGLTAIPGTGLLLTDEQALELTRLLETCEGVAQKVVRTYYAGQSAPQSAVRAARRISEMLAEHRPQLLLADTQDRIIWDPEEPECWDALEAATRGMCDRAAEGVCRDLQLVDERTRQILGRIRDPDALPSHGEEVEQDGGVYLHEDRKMVVYSLRQPGLDTAREGSPPFHTWLLGARVAHEWGHLVADAGWVSVAPQDQQRHDTAREELAARFDTIVQRAPDALRTRTEAQFAQRPPDESIGQAMVALQMRRIGDYQANVFAHAVLPTCEMEAYVRANVRPLAGRSGTTLSKLARYVYEVQYLRFSRITDRDHYFFSSTWFGQNYVDAGIVSGDETLDLLRLADDICSGYVLDPGALRPASR